MKRSFPTSALVVFLLVQSSLAVDLTKIDRTIANEPAYKNKPKYCLLVFGPEAKTKVWLVLDGDVLYVDRNGNGDLTEPGERVEAKSEGSDESKYHSYLAETIQDGKLTHRNLRITSLPSNWNKPDLMSLDFWVDLEMPGRKGSRVGGRVAHTAGGDSSGYLKFADKPDEAPIIHFGGPLQMTVVDDKQKLRIGRNDELRLGIGTPGLGIGSFAFIGEGEVIPERIYPHVKITFPSKNGQPPIKEHYELKERC